MQMLRLVVEVGALGLSASSPAVFREKPVQMHLQSPSKPSLVVLQRSLQQHLVVE
jgi:hypothetical protein